MPPFLCRSAVQHSIRTMPAVFGCSAKPMPTYPTAKRTKAPAHYVARVEEALRWMEERQPDSALLHVFKGDVLAARKLTAEALTEYRKALEIDPRWPDIHLLTGSLFGLLG